VAIPEDLDPLLWIEIEGVEGRCYLFGNPHTFRGRMYAYSEVLASDLAVSKSQISARSPEARYWIEGFLTGNEPSESDALGDSEDDDPEIRFRRWQELALDFRRSGTWRGPKC
jgi:hypothetical protein